MKKTILLVEDNLIVRMTLCELLSAHFGFDVIEAADGVSALEIVGNHLEIVLIISDVQMPRMDGDKLSVEAKKIRPKLPFILMSGSNAPSSHQADRFLMKPPPMGVLKQTIQELLV